MFIVTPPTDNNDYSTTVEKKTIILLLQEDFEAQDVILRFQLVTCSIIFTYSNFIGLFISANIDLDTTIKILYVSAM